MSPDERLSPQVDVEHPWLGLESFDESTRSYFFGRDAEAAELLQRLRLHPLLVLYGRSGLGKTSLLRARLVPDLEKLGARPAFYRISYRRGGDSPLEQLAAALGSWERVDLPGFVLPNDPASRLWLNFHHRERKDRITHLILDQFEEIFTLGAEWSGADAEVRQALAIFVQGAIPPPVETLLDEGEAFLKHFHLDVPPLPVLLSIRQDYVFALNRWRSHLRQLGENHYELRALHGPSAFDAVFNPGELRCHYRGEVNEENKTGTGLPPIITQETAQRIVRFVAQTGEEVPTEEIEAVPPILSLLCRELNELRFTEPAGTPKTPAEQITFREKEADISTIIATFYERCLEGLPKAVRIFIEEELVSRYSGARLQQDERSILKVFTDGCEVTGAADDRRAAGYGNPGGARACLENLVNQRLLTAIGGGENPSYELIHDLLAAVVEKSRTAREKEQAARRAEAERKAKEDAEASAREAARATVLDAALERAVASKKAADKLINFMQYDLSERLGKLGRLDIMDAINARIIKYHEDHPPETGDLDALREKGVALVQQGDVLKAQGDLAGALKSYRDSFGIRERLAEQDPSNAGWQSDLSVSYDRVGDVLKAQGDLAGALKSYFDSLGIREKLATQDPSNAGWQSDLSASYIRVGDVLQVQGKLEAAQAAFGEYLAISRRLVEQDPSNAGWQLELAVAHSRVGDVLQVQGKLEAAQAAFGEYLAISRRLVEQDPSNAGWQLELAVAHSRVGDALQAQGKLEAAQAAFGEYLAISRRLVEQDPSNAGWQLELAVAHSRVGDALQAQGKLEAAQAAFGEYLAISRRLVEQDPSNTGWQSDLSIGYERVGDVQLAQGDLAGALKSYRDSFGIHERLAEQEPSNAGWQSDLAWVYWRTGCAWAEVEPQSKNEARAMVEKGRDILRQLKARTCLTAKQQELLDSVEADLRKMQENNTVKTAVEC